MARLKASCQKTHAIFRLVYFWLRNLDSFLVPRERKNTIATQFFDMNWLGSTGLCRPFEKKKAHKNRSHVCLLYYISFSVESDVEKWHWPFSHAPERKCITNFIWRRSKVLLDPSFFAMFYVHAFLLVKKEPIPRLGLFSLM